MKHHATDELSKLPDAEVDNTELEDKIQVMVVIRINNQDDMKKSVVPSRTHQNKKLPKNPYAHDAGLPLLYEFLTV